MTTKALSVISISLCAMMAFGYWRYKQSNQEMPVAQVGIIKDLSDSTPKDCSQVVALANRALALPETRGGSTIAFLTTGDKSTSYEPQQRVQLTVPEIRLVIEGQRRAEQQRNDLLAKLKEQCSETIVTKASPIFQAVKRGVEYLQTTGAKDDPRYLFVQTDGEETENAQIRAALDQKPGAKLRLPTPVNNRGVRIIFCGAAEIVGVANDVNNKPYETGEKRRSPQRADRLREVWSTLFTEPDRVSFEPFCTANGNENVTAMNSSH
jgi:hypothetical protein